jgi:hypothetical protein
MQIPREKLLHKQRKLEMKKNSNKLFVLVSLVVIFAFIGCANMEASRMKQLESQVTQKGKEITMLKSSLKDRDAAIEQYMGQLNQKEKARLDAEMRAKIAEEGSMKSSDSSSETALLPPGANAGECYARVFIPPTFRTDTEQVIAKEASERIEVIPAQYEWVEEKVLVQEASSRVEQVPAEYKWVSENILVEPAHTFWKKGRGLIEKVDNTTGEIMCLVEVPAKYKTVKRQAMANPASTRKVEIPATFKTVKVRKLVSEPQERRIPIPAEYQTLTKTAQVTEGHLEWQRVLCETNVTPEIISRIQNALANSGFSPGPIDGVLGVQTHGAIKAYQSAKGLATGGLTYETIKSLGI